VLRKLSGRVHLGLDHWFLASVPRKEVKVACSEMLWGPEYERTKYCKKNKKKNDTNPCYCLAVLDDTGDPTRKNAVVDIVHYMFMSLSLDQKIK